MGKSIVCFPVFQWTGNNIVVKPSLNRRTLFLSDN